MLKVTKPMRVGYDAASISMRGHQHNINQDACTVLRIHRGSLKSLFALADGMGGLERGNEASHQAITALIGFFMKAPRVSILPDELLKEGFMEANSQVNQIPRDADQHIGTTLTAGLLYEDKLLVGWLGDSRAYLWRDGNLTMLTKDHTRAQELVDAGELKEVDQGASGANILTRFVGRSSSLLDNQIGLITEHVIPGDVLLFVSDGVSGVIRSEELCYYCQYPTARQITRQIIHRVKQKYGDDDASVIAVKILKNSYWSNWIAPLIVGIFVTISLLLFGWMFFLR